MRRNLLAGLIGALAALAATSSPGEIITKMLTFAALTLVAGGLLARMARTRASNTATSRPASLLRGSGPA